MSEAEAPAPQAPQRAVILTRVCQRCVRELGVDEVTIAMSNGAGGWGSAHTTGTVAAALDEQAFTLGEGPAHDALRTHACVIVADLGTDGERRWPAWSGFATEVGIRSTAAFPIRAGAIIAGVLTLYWKRPAALSPQQLVIAVQLADTALLGLLDLMPGLAMPELAGAADTEQISTFLRGDVHRAAGMVMAQAHVNIDEALARLRAHAFSSGKALSAVAADVLQRRLRFDREENSAQ